MTLAGTGIKIFSLWSTVEILLVPWHTYIAIELSDMLPNYCYIVAYIYQSIQLNIYVFFYLFFLNRKRFMIATELGIQISSFLLSLCI